MKFFRGSRSEQRSRSRQTPPISLILVLVGFILLAFGFLAFRQLRGAQERRLRLLAGFGERVESTVEDLADRVVRIVRVPEESEGGEDGGETQRQRDEIAVARYLEHVPHVSLIGKAAGCDGSGVGGSNAGDAEGDEAGGSGGAAPTEGSVDLWASGPSARLRYCPPAAEAPEEPEDGEPAPPRPEARSGYLAGIDLEGVIEPMIVPGAFDSILLADERGEVLFQEGEPELRMRDLAPLVESATAGDGGGAEDGWWRDLLRGQGAVDPEVLDRLLGEYEDRPLELGARTAMVKVEIAGSEYLVFLQPVSPRLEPPARHGGGEPVRWIACGIISAENLWSAGLTTSPFLLFVLVSILPLAVITWPFLKLSLITRRQPFRRLDLASLLFASVVGIALAALLAFDLLFIHRLHAAVDDQLSDLAGAIESRFYGEVLDAREQLVALNESDGLWPGLDTPPVECTGESPVEEDGLGKRTPVKYIEDPPGQPGRGASFLFVRDEIGPLVDLPERDGDDGGVDLSTYPYFDSAFRATPQGRHGCANLPLREHAVLPQVIEDREYFRCARDCDPAPVFLEADRSTDPERGGAVHEERWSRCGEPVFGGAGEGTVPVCLRSLLDRTTGESVAALALPTPDPDFPVAALVTRLTSVGHPVLPPNFGFAMVDRGGRVLFHSESRRDLSESFLKASDEDPVLRSMLQDRRSGHLGLHYWGQPTRAHVEPLTGLPWSLVTYRNTYDLRVRNFELIYDFLNPFLLYLGALLLVAVGGLVFLPRWMRRYLWPSSDHLEFYGWIVGTAIVWVVLFLAAVLSAGPWVVLAAALGGLPVMAIVAAGGAKRMMKSRDERGRPAAPIQHRHWSFRWLWGITMRKPRWVPLSFLGVLAVASSACLLASDARVVPVLVAALAVGLVAAVVWHRNSFSGERRQVAYVFAFGCVLLVAGLLPALGFFHLARSRQIQLHTQDAQVALARALEARDRALAERQGPLRGIYGAYEEDLEETRDRYLQAAFDSKYHDDEPATHGTPPWPYGIGEPDRQERQEPRKPEPDRHLEPRGSRAGWVARLLSARPFPLNDLSARPVESDLSRFDAEELGWGLQEAGRPVLTYRTQEGTGGAIYLASTIPAVDTLRELSPKTVGLLLALFLLAVSPFLLARFLSEQVLLISLVGEPARRRRRRRTTAVASTPLPIILDDVLHADEVTRQVVLVSTLPGPSAWAGLGLVEEGSEESEEGRRRFHRVDFGDAWRRACLRQGDVDGSGAEREAQQETDRPPGEEEREGRAVDRESLPAATGLADLFYEELVRRELRVEGEQEGAQAGEQKGVEEGRDEAPQADPPDDQPVLVTQFAPELEKVKHAADQVAALRRLTRDDRRSVVILAETVPDPELAGDSGGGVSRPAARRLWTELLATYAVEYGHDSRTYDIEAKVGDLHGQIEEILKLDPSGGFREELHAIERNLRHVERECSPNPLLRNIGWSMLGQIEGALPRLLEDVEVALPERAPSSADPREKQGAVRKALRRAQDAYAGDRTESEEGEEGAKKKELAQKKRAEAAAALEEVLIEARDASQNPVVLLRREAIRVAGDGYAGSELLARATELLREGRPDQPEMPAADEPPAATEEEEARRATADPEKDREDALDFVEKVRNDLWREFVEVDLRNRRIGRARSLLQLFTREHIVSKVGAEARLHYRYLWSRCTPDEKLVLVQLSEEGLVNPKYFGWLMDLMNRGLVVRDPEIRVMNESFQRFVRQEVQRSQVREWQEEEGPSGWSVLKWILPAPLVLVAAFLFITQRDALSNVTGVVIVLVSLAPILINLYGQFRQVSAQKEGGESGGEAAGEGAGSGAGG